jgi:HEAT repeat protein
MDADRLDALIASFARLEPPFSSLGTPFLVDTEATNAVVALGSAALPKLGEALAGKDANIAMYAAYCLGLIGDPAALPALLRARERYASHEPKQAGDYAVLSGIDRAVERLQA